MAPNDRNSAAAAESREIAIFWDYESTPLPDWCNASRAAKAIADAVSQYGRIVDRRLYYDFSSSSSSIDAYCTLEPSGFVLVNTPTRSNSNAKLAVDMMTFAWDSSVRLGSSQSKPCVILLTGESNYAYTLNKLRDRGIMTVVMVGAGDGSDVSVLIDTADVVLSLEKTVMKGASRQVKTTDEHLSESRDGNGSMNNSLSKNQVYDEIMVVVCSSVQRATESSPDEWSEFGAVSAAIQKAIRQTNANTSPDTIKEKAKKVRHEAVSNGYIAIGRRKLDNSSGNEREIIVSNDRRLKLSSEVYVRLLPKGNELLQQTNNVPKGQQSRVAPPKKALGAVDDSSVASSKKSTASSKTTSPKNPKSILFLPRVPKDSDVRELVSHLEDTFHVTVRRALVDGPNAHVEFQDANDAVVILRAANKKGGGDGIFFNGESLGAVSNTRSNPFHSKMNSNAYYEKQSTPPASRQPLSRPDSNSTVPQENTSDDTTKFCLSISSLALKTGQESDSWVSAAIASGYFRSQLGAGYLKSASKENVHARYKQARTSSIQEGLVEVGRRNLSSDGTSYLAVSLADISTYKKESNLSPELYLRLRPSGQKVVTKVQESPSRQPSPPLTPRTKLIFLSNLPKATTATELVDYLETLACQVQSVVLEERRFKEESVRGAHVECASVDDATRLLRQTNKSRGGLVYCGRSIYAVPDRSVPNDCTRRAISSVSSDMLFVGGGNSTVASSLDDDTKLAEGSFVHSEPADAETEEREFYVIEEDFTSNVVSPDDKSRSIQASPS